MGPGAGQPDQTFYFYNPVDGATLYLNPSGAAGMQHATFMGVSSVITYFGSWGDPYGNGADVGLFTRASGGAQRNRG